ncbi:MAG: hypothetical protein JWM98_88 [Thermoleophilia bacterium]|nr:hypothetical protein [Thermoleophilia bacterium]
MRGIVKGLIAVGAVAALAGCSAAGMAARPDEANAHDDDAPPPGDGPSGSGPSGTSTTAPAPTPTPTSTTAPAEPSTPAADGHVRLQSNWDARTGPALDQLASTTFGARLIDAYRAGGAPIEVDASLATPASYQYRTTTVDHGTPVVTPRRVAITPDAIADPRTAATLLGHELIHFVDHTAGTPLSDAVEGATGISEHARRVMDETMAYTVQRELTEVLHPQPSPGRFTYEGHSSTLDGFDDQGQPKFGRRSLVATFDAVAADPIYRTALGLKPDEFAASRPAIVSALRAATPALDDYVPADHISVE